ncbi:pseudouridine synthase, partial [Testicularia cyperi]
AKRTRFDSSADASGEKKWERRDGRGTRGGRDRAAANSDAEQGADDAGNGSEPRLPKRKVAVKFGYCGIGYSGLQINPGVKTIEGDIFDAFCKAGAVSKDNAVNPNKVGLQRAARTDRGVHAAGNLLSLKLILEPSGLEEGQTLQDRVNGLLPDFIRIWGITRVQNGFNARTSCDSRQYEYLLPTYVFIPPKPGTAMHEMLVRMRREELEKKQAQATTNGEASTSSSTTSLDEVVDHPFWASHGTTSEFATDIKAKKQWRIPAAQVDRIRSIFAKYSGSHNFHNFTVGKEFRDRSNQRFMKELTISDPKIINGTEWLSIKFHGQSFMLHQIRKMIGLLVLIGRTNAPAELIPECFGPARIHIPKAPGLGLLLEQPLFGAYNVRIKNNNSKLDKIQAKSNGKNDVEDEKRDAVTYAPHESEMTAFKQKYIYDRIMVTEEETSEFGKWLNYLDVFQGPDFEFLNPRGVIPPIAIMKVGEFHRNKPLESAEESGNTNAAANDEEDEDREAYGKSGKDLEEYEG